MGGARSAAESEMGWSESAMASTVCSRSGSASPGSVDARIRYRPVGVRRWTLPVLGQVRGVQVDRLEAGPGRHADRLDDRVVHIRGAVRDRLLDDRPQITRSHPVRLAGEDAQLHQRTGLDGPHAHGVEQAAVVVDPLCRGGESRCGLRVPLGDARGRWHWHVRVVADPLEARRQAHAVAQERHLLLRPAAGVDGRRGQVRARGLREADGAGDQDQDGHQEPCRGDVSTDSGHRPILPQPRDACSGPDGTGSAGRSRYTAGPKRPHAGRAGPGDVAQLEEHCVRIAGVRGSSPLISTNLTAAAPWPRYVLCPGTREASGRWTGAPHTRCSGGCRVPGECSPR